ncbi:unnamed protein product [Zymoseptoria tritici ST99CH_1E4]|uniref:Swiss Army Knife RNA repair protein HAD domain-containing protein n=1 Tax=Zymoseptoria tritici ST99CH_1E4 TaxID=1276532 RepID=A0A2H1H4A8_ZYMTR|nr:unnamed protein product [Zymoseptoria tritici ST99CH_1E4]
MSVNTPTALSRWSCQNKQMPPVGQIEHIHIYDFDNTLFSSPLPNKNLWNAGTCGQLQAQEFMTTGGWWHNPSILAATGLGAEQEEARGWQGSWNESIVQLVELSMADSNTLTVLLTGRKEDGFSELIGKMLASKGLVFDMVCLKPAVGPSGDTYSSTMLFKQALLKDIVFTYAQAKEIRIYEDRIKHVKGFQEFFYDINQDLQENPVPRAPIIAEVVHVKEQENSMSPEVEVAEVQKMINVNNAAVRNGTAPRNTVPYKIKRSVFYTGYIISTADMEKLRSLIRLPSNCPEHEIRPLANNILITPRPAPRSILDKVGGIGAKMTWKVTGLAVHESRVWAARVDPANPGARYYTENSTPCVVLATRRQAKPIEANRIQNWQPVPDDQAFTFETVVGEKVLLRIEQEQRFEDDYEASFPTAKNAKKHPREADDARDHQPRQAPQTGRGGYQQHVNRGAARGNGNAFNSPRGGGGGMQRGGANGANGNGGGRGARGGGGGGGGGRGRGGRGGGGDRGGGRGRGRGGYRSLDDNVGQGYGSGGMQY